MPGGQGVSRGAGGPATLPSGTLQHFFDHPLPLAASQCRAINCEAASGITGETPVPLYYSPRDQMLPDDPAADQMLLDDPFEHLRIAPGVPCPLGIDHRDRSTGTDPQAVGLGTIDPPGAGQLQLVEPTFQELPRPQRLLLARTLRFRLIATQKDMPPDFRHTDLLGPARQRGLGLFVHRLGSSVVGQVAVGYDFMQSYRGGQVATASNSNCLRGAVLLECHVVSCDRGNA